MSPWIKRWIKRIKLAVLWVRRILFSKDHFRINPFKRLYLNICGYTADQSYIYDFEHNDRHEYLSEFDWYRSRYINEPFEPMLNNKIITTEVLKHYVDVPRVLLLKNKGSMVSLEYEQADGYRTDDDVLELMREHDSLFMKPLAAGKGKGVHRLEMIDGRPAVDGAIMSQEEFHSFLDADDGWFLSEGVHQHPYLDAIYDKTTNTIRLITLRDPDSGDYKVFFAVQRIGTSETIPVDNGSKGGLVARIDLETGELSEARSIQALGSHDVHPDSGAPIKGVVVPGWNDIKEQILDLARHFPFMSFIAWDILVTEDGFSIIEANTSSGVNIIQLWGPQRDGELGDFYRAHGAIK